MRVDISRDPKATHYCMHCGLTMKARDELFCRDRDGDLCEAKKREPKKAPRLVKKTMPYTKSAFKAAEEWLDSSGTGECLGDDGDAVLESLAQAFTVFAAASSGGRAR